MTAPTEQFAQWVRHPGDDWILTRLEVGMRMLSNTATIDLLRRIEGDHVLEFAERHDFGSMSVARRQLRRHLDRLVKVGALETHMVSGIGEYRGQTRWRVWSIAGWHDLTNMSDQTVLSLADPHMESCASRQGHDCNCADWTT